MIEHDACVGCLYEDESSDSVCCQGCTQNAIDRYVPAPKEAAIKYAAELGELKGKAAQKDAGNIQETLNNLPDDLIGKNVWTHFGRAVVPAQIMRIEIDSEGTRVYLFCEAVGGAIERRPEDIFDTAYEALEAKTTI